MMSKKMQSALNDQIKAELESAYLYLSMAACFHEAGLDGMGQWMRVQAKEEEGHAMKFFDHLVDRQARAIVPEIAKPKEKWSSPLEAFQAAYAHEQKVTARIHDLVKLARDEDDQATGIMLQWFVSEQVEEEANAAKVVQTLERIGDSGAGLIMLDHQLGERKG